MPPSPRLQELGAALVEVEAVRKMRMVVVREVVGEELLRSCLVEGEEVVGEVSRSLMAEVG
jgi:hypothetical protein